MDRYSYADGDLPKTHERHIDFEDVPEDLVRDIAHEVVVRASCDACGHEGIYCDWPNSLDDHECRNPDCDHQLLFPH